jgi:hypothetical protein
LYGKLFVLLSPFSTYMRSTDLIFALVVLAPFAYAAVQGTLRLHAGLALTAGAIAMLAVLSPTALAGTWWIDNRFPLMAVLAFMAGCRPELNAARRTRAVIALLLMGLLLARTGWITAIWHERQEDVHALRRAVEPVAPGSAILPLDLADDKTQPEDRPVGRYFHNGHPTHWSMPVLAIMWRRAFVPNLFWAAGKQPLRVLSPWNEICFAEDGLWPLSILQDPKQTPEYFASWRERYDYVLLINGVPGAAPDMSALPELRLERDEGFARLYRVRKAPIRPSGMLDPAP